MKGGLRYLCLRACVSPIVLFLVELTLELTCSFFQLPLLIPELSMKNLFFPLRCSEKALDSSSGENREDYERNIESLKIYDWAILFGKTFHLMALYPFLNLQTLQNEVMLK